MSKKTNNIYQTYEKIVNPKSPLMQQLELFNKKLSYKKEKKLLFYRYATDEEIATYNQTTNEKLYVCYDGEKEFFVEGFKMMSKAERYDSNYSLCKCIYCSECIKSVSHATLKDCYDNFVADNTAILKEIRKISKKGKYQIDLRINGNIPETTLRLFLTWAFEKLEQNDGSNKLNSFKLVKGREKQYINNCGGGLSTCIKDLNIKVKSYDIKSFYPSIMKSESFLIPMCEGEYFNLKNIEEAKIGDNEFKFGIYKCEITHERPADKREFYINPHKYYTHEDIETAYKLNYEIKMVSEEDNFLYYSADKLIDGKTLFGDYVDYLFSLRDVFKHDSNLSFTIKQMLNSLWGVLVETRTFFGTMNNLNLDENESVIKKYDDDMFEIINNETPYKTRFARLKPFILSRGRNTIFKMIEPYNSDVVRIATDGFLVKSSCKHNIITGNNMGDLKFEFEENVNIINTNKVEIICNKCHSSFDKKFRESHICKVIEPIKEEIQKQKLKDKNLKKISNSKNKSEGMQIMKQIINKYYN